MQVAVYGLEEKPAIENLVGLAAYYVKEKLMPRVQNLDVMIDVVDEEEVDGLAGYCLPVDRRSYEIQIRDSLPLIEMITTVIHEMVHVKQGFRQEWKYDPKKRSTIWKGTEYVQGTPYMECPWEIEAHDLEEKLTFDFLQKINNRVQSRLFLCRHISTK